MVVVAHLKDGRVIARAALSNTVIASAGNAAMTATVSDLKKVEYVLQYNITTSAAQRTDAPRDQKVVGNAVGVTVYAAAGCTVGGEVLAIGF